MKHLSKLSYSHNCTKHLLSTPLGLLCAKDAILDETTQQRPCSDVSVSDPQKLWFRHVKGLSVHKHQSKAGEDILTLHMIMFTTQCHSSMRTKLYQWATTNFKNMVLLKHNKAEIQMLQPLGSSDHNSNYCTMFTK